MSSTRRSWFAPLSALLGLLSLFGVLCFHFPELLTSREFRQVYTEQFARNLLLFGLVSAFVLGTLAILVGLQAVLAHANLGLRFGWLEYVLVLPRYHHWHHAREPGYVDANYAIRLPLVDMLTGTFKLPRDGSWREVPPGETGPA